jgi:Protein of unknown function (DUF1579)
MRNTYLLSLGACALLFLAIPAAAQQGGEAGSMSPEEQAWMATMMPGAPHAELAQQVGNWNMKVTMWMEPGAPPSESTGTCSREMIHGGRVLVEKVHGTMMGMPMEGLGMTGYDNVTDSYWSTWTDNFSTGLMRTEGVKNADGSLTFKGTMGDPMSKQQVPLRIVLSYPSKDKELFDMYETRDGAERKSMAIVYERAR